MNTFLWYYRLACYLGASVCLIYMATILYGYLMTDWVSYLPSVGQWLIGLFLASMVLVSGKQYQGLNILFLAGLSGLVAVF